MQGNRDVIDWEHQLASIIDKSNKNLLKISSEYSELKRRHDSNSSSKPLLCLPPPPTQHSQHLSGYHGGDNHWSDVNIDGNRHQNRSSVGPHQRAAMAAFNASKMNGNKITTRPISRSSEEDILRRLETRMSRTVERMVNEKLKSTSLAMDSFKDQISVIAEEIRGLNKSASSIAQTVSSQERAIDLLRHDVDSRREFLLKMESQVLDQNSWKTMTESEISQLKQAAAKQKDSLATKPSLVDVKRYVESAKIDLSMSLAASMSSFQEEFNSLKEYLEKKIDSTIQNNADPIDVVENAIIAQAGEIERKCLELTERKLEILSIPPDSTTSTGRAHNYWGKNTIDFNDMFQDEEFLEVLTKIVAKTMSNVERKSECVKPNSCEDENGLATDTTICKNLEALQKEVHSMKKRVVENLEPEISAFKGELKLTMERQSQLVSEKRVDELVESKIEEKTKQNEINLKSAISIKYKELESIEKSVKAQRDLAEKLKNEHDALSTSCSLCPTKSDANALLTKRDRETCSEDINSVRMEFDNKVLSTMDTLTSQLYEELSKQGADFERKLGMHQTHCESLCTEMELVKELDSKIRDFGSVMGAKVQTATQNFHLLEERVQCLERNRAAILERMENVLKVDVVEDMIDSKTREIIKSVNSFQERQLSMENCVSAVENNISSLEDLVALTRKNIQESSKSDIDEVTDYIRFVENDLKLSIERLSSSVDEIPSMVREKIQNVVDLIPPIEGKIQILQKSDHRVHDDMQKSDMLAIQSVEGRLMSEIKDVVAKTNECCQRLKEFEQNKCGEKSCQLIVMADTKAAVSETVDSDSDVFDSISHLRDSLKQTVDVARSLEHKKTTCGHSEHEIVDETILKNWQSDLHSNEAGTSKSQKIGESEIVESARSTEHASGISCISAMEDGMKNASRDESAEVGVERGISVENNRSNFPGNYGGVGILGLETISADAIDESIPQESANCFDGLISLDPSPSISSELRKSDFNDKITSPTENDSGENCPGWSDRLSSPSKRISCSDGEGNSSCRHSMAHSDPPVNTLKSTYVDTVHETNFVKDDMICFSDDSDGDPRFGILELPQNKLLCSPKKYANQTISQQESSDSSIPESIEEIFDTSDSMSSNLLVSPNDSPIDNDRVTNTEITSIKQGLFFNKSGRKESPIGLTQIDDSHSRSRGIPQRDEDGNENNNDHPIHSGRHGLFVSSSNNEESCNLNQLDENDDLIIGLSNPQNDKKICNDARSGHRWLSGEYNVADEYLLHPEDISDSERGSIRSYDEYLSCENSTSTETNQVENMKRISIESNRLLLEPNVHRGWDKQLWKIKSTGLVLRDSTSPVNSKSDSRDIGNTRASSDDESYGSSGFESDG